MNTRKRLSFLMAAFAIICFSSCQDWGEMDAPAGNQIYPKLELVASYAFDEELDPTVIQPFAYNGGEVPMLAEDSEHGSVLHLDKGYARIANPLNSVKVQNGVSLSFWVKQAVLTNEETGDTSQDLEGALFSFQNTNSTQRMFFTANGWLSYEGIDGTFEENNPEVSKTGLMSAGEWHYVAMAVTNDGYFVYVDGLKKIERTITDFNCSKIVNFMASVPYLYIGYGADSETQEMWIDDLKIYRNTITSKEWNQPSISGGGNESVSFPDPIYINTFEGGPGNSTIFGGGSIKSVGGMFSDVFSNATGGMRTNYLILPSDLLSQSAETEALSIGVWVNRGNETDASNYMWAPLFTAYTSGPETENTLPMLACQYRGTLQVNCNGWSDYTNAQNVAGANTEYNGNLDWLSDGEWHYYTATFTPTTAKVYIDGNIANEWEIDGSNNTAAGLFSNGYELQYICLGGNQAWSFGDNDPGFWFDDIAIYNEEISPAQIKRIMNKKKAVYFNDFETGGDDATIYGEGSFISSGDPVYGKIFSNVGGSQRSNYLVLPEDVLSHSVDTEALSIAVWVNRGNETNSSDYMWAPLFTAYASGPTETNSLPMLACQYRGLLQVNCNGWSDYEPHQNAAGVNTEYNGDLDWLADDEWHLYTAVFTPTIAKVYFDGTLKNEWVIDGVANTAAGLFSNGYELKYICLGGNQAWSFGDNDPGFWFDDIAIYNEELTVSDMMDIIFFKKQ